jgi:imidazolonepropionase-like amidohydrolase
MTFPNYYPGIKFALGENVIRNQSRFPNTRMGVEATIRRGLRDAQMYQAEWDEYNAFSAREKRRTIPPRRDLRLEALAGILKGEILVHCHSYNMDEIFMILKTLSDFGVRHMTLEHALEAYKIAPEVAAFGDAGAYMSTFADGWAYKIEAWDAIPYNVALIEEAGGNPIINSDSGNTVRWLYLEAAKMVRYGGLTYQDAIQTITYNTARALKIDDRAGTVEVDKKADIALYNGHPLNTYARPFMTLIDGEVVFERKGERGGPHPLPAKRDIAPTVPATNADGRYAIVNATIHPVSGPTIQRGTVVIENGRIAAVGANVTAPAGATVVNAEGLHVYPGLIDGGGTVGLNEIGSIGETNDANESGNIQPDIRAAAAVKPDSVVVGVTRFTGITSAVARPTGGAIPGQSALIQLDGWTPAEMAYVPELTLEVSLPGGGANVDFDRIMNANYTGGGNFKTLMELFAKARDYGARKRAAEAADARFPELDHQLEALLPYAEKRRKVVLAASGAVDILTAIDFAAALDIDAIIRGAGDGWRVADKLAASGIPCIIGPVLTTPGSYEPYDMAYANAARMHEAGVKFGFQSNDSANARNMPFEAGTAVAFGLPADVALRACTLTTAEIYGVDGEVGSIDVGKRADIIVVDRDPLQATSNVITMFINGKPVDVEDNKHTQLYKRYQRRIADEPR